MKIIFSMLAVLLIFGGAYSYSSYQKNLLRNQQLSSYERQVQQLLTQIEQSSRRSLGHETQIRQLRSELLSTNSQLTSMSAQLQATQARVNPDYQLLENEIRQQVIAEFQQQSTNSNSRLNLIRQLSALDPIELGELMSIQGQFGGFLQSLDIGDARMEVIVGALSNMISDQNQARMDIMLQMRSQAQDANPREMRTQIRNQMTAINSPEAQREALSYVLTDEELGLLEDFQSDQQGLRSGQPFYVGPLSTSQPSSLPAGDGVRSSILRFDTIQLRQGLTELIQITPTEPQY